MVALFICRPRRRRRRGSIDVDYKPLHKHKSFSSDSDKFTYNEIADVTTFPLLNWHFNLNFDKAVPIFITLDLNSNYGILSLGCTLF